MAGIGQVMRGKEWIFACNPWQEAFCGVSENDYIYLDPPYIGRDTSYVGEWTESEGIAVFVKSVPHFLIVLSAAVFGTQIPNI